MIRRLDFLARLPEDDRLLWAGDRMMEAIDDEVAMALHIAGWKIVSQDDPSRLWPFSADETGCDVPPWCEDLNVGPVDDETEARQKEIDARWDELVGQRSGVLAFLEAIQKDSDDNPAVRVLKKDLAQEVAQWSDDWRQQALRDGWSEDDLAAMAEGRATIAVYVRCFEKTLASLDRQIATLMGGWVSNQHPTKQ